MRERESHENDTEVFHHARYPRAQSLGNDRALKGPGSLAGYSAEEQL